MKLPLATLVAAILCLHFAAEVCAEDAEKALGQLETQAKSITEQFRKKLSPSARAAFDTGDDFEISDRQLRSIVRLNAGFQTILKRSEQLRQQIIKEDVTPTDPRLGRLDELERLVAHAVGEKDRFSPGAKWQGTLNLPDGAQYVELKLKKLSGDKFFGELSECYRGGRPYCMEMRGRVTGINVTIATGKMILGQPRALECEGIVFRNRMVAKVMAYHKEKKGGTVLPGMLELTFSPAKGGK